MVFRKIIGVCQIHNKREYITWPETETLRRVNIRNTGNQVVTNITDSGLWNETSIGEYSLLNTTDIKIRHQYSDKFYERK